MRGELFRISSQGRPESDLSRGGPCGKRLPEHIVYYESGEMIFWYWMRGKKQ